MPSTENTPTPGSELEHPPETGVAAADEEMLSTPTPERIQLGKTDIQISPVGTGAWQWGDRFIWGFGRNYQSTDVRAAFDASLAGGINFFDTAEIYASGKSERHLGSFLPETDQEVVVASKFMPFPWRLGKGALLRALKRSLKRLEMTRVDLYQIHWPSPPVAIETWAEALAEAVENGGARAVGVSNYNESQMRRAYTALAKRGIPLASNQVSYSLLDRKVELNGLLATCQELGITLIAYSPLAQGVLTGKYTPDNPMSGVRARRYNTEYLEKAQPLLRKMRKIGRAHGEKTEAQVALNWLLCKGTAPIPGAKNAHQAGDNAAAMGWRMSEDEVALLDEASAGLRES